jgi:hypothetical protein
LGRCVKKDFRLIGFNALQLKLPNLRSLLAANPGVVAAQTDLIASYGEAIDFRDRIRREPDTNPDLVREYDRLCDELERELQQIISGGLRR